MVVVKFHSCYLAGALRETDSEEGSSSEFTLDGFALDFISAHGDPEPTQTPENLDDVDAPLYQLGMLPSKIQQKEGLQVKPKKKQTAKERRLRENLRAPVNSKMRNSWNASRPGKPRKPNKRPALSRGEENLNSFKLSWKEEDDEGGWDEYQGPTEDNWLFSQDYNPPKPSKTLRDFLDGTSLLDSIQAEGCEIKSGVLQQGGINPWNVNTMPWPTEHIFNQPKVPISPVVTIPFKDPVSQPMLYPPAIDDRQDGGLISDFEFDHDIELEMALWLSLDDNNPPAERPKPIEPAVPPLKKTEPPPPQEHPFKESPILTAADFRDSSPSSSLNLCGASDLARDEYVVQTSPIVKGGHPVSPRVKLKSPHPGHLTQSPSAVLYNENNRDVGTFVHEECGKSSEPVVTRLSQSKVKSTQSQTPPPSAFLSMHQEQTPPEGEHARPLVSGKMEEPSPKLTAKKRKKRKKKRVRRKKRQQEAAARNSKGESTMEKFNENGRKRGYNVQAKISPLVARKKEAQILDHETRRDISFRRSKKPSGSHFDWQKKPPKSPEKKAVTWNSDGVLLNQGSPVSSTSLASHRKPPSPLTHPLAIKSNTQSQSLRARQHPLALTHIRDMNQKSPLDPNAEQFFPPPNYSLPPKLHNGRAKEVNSSRRCGEDIIRELRLVLGSNGRSSSHVVSTGDGSIDEASMVEKVVEEEMQTTYMSSCSEWSEENLSTEEENVHTEEILRPPVAKPNPIEALRSTPGKNPTQRLQINSTPGNRTQKPWEKVLGSTPGGGGGEARPKPVVEQTPEWDTCEASESYFSESEQEPVRVPQPMKALIPKYEEEPVLTVTNSPPRQNPYRSAVPVSSNLAKWAHPRTPSYKLAPKRFPFPRPLDKVKEPNRGPKPEGRSNQGSKPGKRSSKPGKRLTKKYKLERQTKDNMSARRSGKDYEAGGRHSLDVDSSARKSSNRSCGLVFGPHSRDGSDLPSIRSKKRRRSRSRRNRKSPNRFSKASSKQTDLARTPKPKPVPPPAKTSKSIMARARDKPKLCPMKPVAAKSATRSSRKKKKVLFQDLANKSSNVNPGPWANKNRDRMQTKQRDTEKSYMFYSEGEKSSEVLPSRQSPIKQALSRTQVSSRRKKTTKKRKVRWGPDGLNFATPDFSEDQVKEAIRLSLLTNPNDNSNANGREERVQRRLDEKCTTLQYIRPNCIVTIDTYKGSKLRGVVEHVMTTASTDPRGIRVKLKSGEIGRVWRLEKGVNMVDCPICTKAFPQGEIDGHLRHTHFI